MVSSWPPEWLAWPLLENWSPSGLELKTLFDLQGDSYPLFVLPARSQNKGKTASIVGWGPRSKLGPLGPCQRIRMGEHDIFMIRWLEGVCETEIDHHTQSFVLLHFGSWHQGHGPLLPDWHSYLISNYDLPCLVWGAPDISHLLQDTASELGWEPLAFFPCYQSWLGKGKLQCIYLQIIIWDWDSWVQESKLKWNLYVHTLKQ